MSPGFRSQSGQHIETPSLLGKTKGLEDQCGGQADSEGRGPLPGTAPHPKEMKEMCASDIPVSSERLYRDIAFLFYIDPLHSIFT